MLDIIPALLDPELGSVSFPVERITCRRDRGQAVPVKCQTFQASGCIHPAAPEHLQLLPEEQRKEEAIVIYTSFSLSSGENFGRFFTLPDRITYAGSLWRIVRIRTWVEFSCCQAIALRMNEEVPDASR